jgi:hypothetical protein
LTSFSPLLNTACNRLISLSVTPFSAERLAIADRVLSAW